jgi:hypothetical protein
VTAGTSHGDSFSSRRLQLDAIVHTAAALSERVHDRFPGRGIDKIAGDLCAVSEETRVRLARVVRPRWLLRLSLAALGLVAVASVALVVLVADFDVDVNGLDDWLELLETGIQDLVYIAIAALFVAGAEQRVKRREVLEGLYELRSIAHVIDMHQLTKDPRSTTHPDERTIHSPHRPDSAQQLSHYLDYCSEMLSIINKLAALYSQESQDSVVLGTVSDIQDLTTSLSSKMWQKIMIIDAIAPA